MKLPDKTGNTTGASNPQEKVPAASRSSGRVDELLKFAESLKGTKYRYGGTTPATGFDCSGYVCYVYKRFGIDLARSSASQYKTNGTSVERENLQPGDLVFFNTSGRGISHVGIYLGNDEFIHASSSKGGVKVNNLKEQYWNNRYVGAKRVLVAE